LAIDNYPLSDIVSHSVCSIQQGIVPLHGCVDWTDDAEFREPSRIQQRETKSARVGETTVVEAG